MGALLLATALWFLPTSSFAVDPSEQSAWTSVPLWRNYGDTLWVRVTGTNCYGVRACPDTIGGTATIDTVGTCFLLEYDTIPQSWKAPVSRLYPSSTSARAAFSLYLVGSGGEDDTLVASGVRLDLGAPMLGTVDSASVAVAAIHPAHLDSAGTYTVDHLETNGITLRQAPAGGSLISAPSGTADALASVLSASGGGTGDALSVSSWVGRGLYFERATSALGSNAITLDMSSDIATAGYPAGVYVDASSDGNVIGLNVLSDGGSRSGVQYGVKSNVTSSSTVTDSTWFAGYFRSAPSVAGIGRGVGLWAEGGSGGRDRALMASGDVVLGGAKTDSVGIVGRADFDTTAAFHDSLYAVDGTAASVYDLDVRNNGTIAGDLTVTGTLTAGAIPLASTIPWVDIEKDSNDRYAPDTTLWLDGNDTLFVKFVRASVGDKIELQDTLMVPRLYVQDSVYVANNLTVFNTVRADTVMATYAELGNLLHEDASFEHVRVDTLSGHNDIRITASSPIVADSLWTLTYLYANEATMLSLTMDDGPIVGASIVETDTVATVGINASRALVVGSAGSGDADVNGTLTVTGITSLATVYTTGKVTVGNDNADSLAVLGPLRVRNGKSITTTGNVTAEGGTVTAGDSDTGGSLVWSDGSSNTFALPSRASTVNWTCPIPIWSDTLLCSTSRTLHGDRIGSKYVQGLLSTDLAQVSMPGGTAIGAIVQTWGIGVSAVNDSIAYSWTLPMDGKTAVVTVFRK